MASDHSIVGAGQAPHAALIEEHTAHGTEASQEAQGFTAAVFASLAILLMALAPWATRAAPIQKGWWVEPKTWPLLCLSVTFIAAAYQALKWGSTYRLADDREAYLSKSLSAFASLKPAFEYAAYFCIYLFAVGYLGFAVSSFVFMQFMVWLAGLRGWPWRIASALFIVALVLAFRVGIQLWFPMAPVFEHGPDWFVQNIAIYL